MAGFSGLGRGIIASLSRERQMAENEEARNRQATMAAREGAIAAREREAAIEAARIGKLSEIETAGAREQAALKAQQTQGIMQSLGQIGQAAAGIAGGAMNIAQDRRLDNQKVDLIQSVYGNRFIGTQEENKKQNPLYQQAVKTKLFDKVKAARELMYEKAQKPEGFYTQKKQYRDPATGATISITPAKYLRKLQKEISAITGGKRQLAQIYSRQQQEGANLDKTALSERSLAARTLAARSQRQPAKKAEPLYRVKGVGDLTFDQMLKYRDQLRKEKKTTHDIDQDIKGAVEKKKQAEKSRVERRLKSPITVVDSAQALADYENFAIEQGLSKEASALMIANARSMAPKLKEKTLNDQKKRFQNIYEDRLNKINEQFKNEPERIIRKLNTAMDMAEENFTVEQVNERIAEGIAVKLMGNYATNPKLWSTGEAGRMAARDLMKNYVYNVMREKELLKEKPKHAWDYIDKPFEQLVARINKENPKGTKMGNLHFWNPDYPNVQDNVLDLLNKNEEFKQFIPEPITWADKDVQQAVVQVINNPAQYPAKFMGLVAWFRAQGELSSAYRSPNRTDGFDGWNNPNVRNVLRNRIAKNVDSYLKAFPAKQKAKRKTLQEQYSSTRTRGH